MKASSSKEAQATMNTTNCRARCAEIYTKTLALGTLSLFEILGGVRISHGHKTWVPWAITGVVAAVAIGRVWYGKRRR